MEMSRVAPTPLRSRRRRAARTEVTVYIAAAMSAVGIPVLVALSGVPVTETRPVSAWTSMS